MKQNASSYIMMLPSSNQSYISTEQPFVQKSTVLQETKAKMIIPYNMTPLVKLYEPVKTKFTRREVASDSIQYFNEPAEYSQAEIELLDQSMDKSMQLHSFANYDPLPQIQMPNPQTGKMPQLFIEPPILIPYLMDFINWDVSKLRMIARNNDDDDVTRYMNFYKHFKSLTVRIQKKYYTAKTLIQALIEKYQLVQRFNELQSDVKRHLENQMSDLTNQSLEQLNKREWVQQEIDFQLLRQRVYEFRQEGFEVLFLTEHVEDCALQESSFTDQLNTLRAELDHSYDLFEEQVLTYIFHDVAGVEACLHYLIDDQYDEEKLELKFFNSISDYVADLDHFGVELRLLVKQLSLIIKGLVDKSGELMRELNKAHRQLEIEVKKIVQLFNEIPAIITKMQLSITQAKIILQKVKLPHNNYRAYNQEIYDEYLKLQEENTRLEYKVQRRLNQAAIISPVCEEQKNVLQLEITQLKDDNKNVIELYQLLNGIQEKEFQLSKIQQKRNEIWQLMKQVRTEELHELSVKELQSLEKDCLEIIRQITSYFGQDRMPPQFVKLKMWAESELMALKVNQDVPKIDFHTLDASLKQRIEHLVKWEYSKEDNEEVNVSQYVSFFLNEDNAQQPEIEAQIEQQLEQLCENPYYESMLDLNETYTIWKNMQTAGIYLNDEYLRELLESHDKERLTVYRKKVGNLGIFFKLMQLQKYDGYVSDVLQIVDNLLMDRKETAQQIIQESRQIPKMYRDALLGVL